MGLKLALVMLIVMGVMGSGFYWYYQDSQATVSYTHLTLPTNREV